jgi:hypothetical protein
MFLHLFCMVVKLGLIPREIHWTHNCLKAKCPGKYSDLREIKLSEQFVIIFNKEGIYSLSGIIKVVEQ